MFALCEHLRYKLGSINHLKLRHMHMKFLYNLIGIPRLREVDLIKYRDLLNAPADELKLLTRFRARFKKTHAILPMIGYTFLIYQSYFLVSVMLYAAEPASTIEHYCQLNGTCPMKLRRLACMVTDCAHLNLNTLPFFKICNPIVGYYYGPPSGLHLFGYIIQTIYIFSVFFIDCIAPFMLYFVPIWQEAYVFAIVPISVESSRKHQIKLFIKDFHISSKNFLENCCINKQQEKLLNNLVAGSCTNQRNEVLEDRLMRHYIRYSYLKGKQFDLDYNLMSEQNKTCIVDCMSIFRTKWWQYTLVKSMNFAVFYNFIGGIGILIVFNRWIEHAVEMRKFKLEQIARGVYINRCHLWRLVNNEREMQEVDLNEDMLSLSFVTVLEILSTLMPVVLILDTVLAIFYHNLLEYYNMIVEQVDRTILATRLVLLFIENKLDTELNYEADSPMDRYKFIRLKHRHRTLINKCQLLKSFSFVHEDVDNPTEMAEQIAPQPMYLNSLVEALMKIYVGNRQLFYSIQVLSTSVENIFIISIVLCYSYIAIAIYYNVKLQVANNLPFIFGFSGALANNVFILLASRCQSQSKALSGSLWTLMALSSSFTDVRIKHLRVLWLKQLLAIHRGAPALKVKGIAITYATVFKLIIWTSTLILLATVKKARDTLEAIRL